MPRAKKPPTDKATSIAPKPRARKKTARPAGGERPPPRDGERELGHEEERDDGGDGDGEQNEPIDGEVADVDVDVEKLPRVKASEASIAHYDPMAAYLREVQRHPLLTPEADARPRRPVREGPGPAHRGRSSSRPTCGWS